MHALIKILNFIRFHILAFLSALLLLGLTLLIFWETQQGVDEQNKVLFDLRTTTVRNAIEKRMQDYIQILKGAQGLFLVSDTVTRTEWITYVENLEVDKNFPGILGIGYAAFVSAKDLQAFEERIKSSGFPQFHVWPKYPRELYSSIVYLDPLDEMNQRAIGYDMFTDSTRREAMEKARDLGIPALSGSVILVQETGQKVQKGFLLYLPLYAENQYPQTVEERRATITGYVYSPFRAHDLMEGIFRSRFSDLNIEIYDSPGMLANTLLFSNEAFRSNPTTDGNELEKQSTIQIGAHTWQLYFTAPAEFGHGTAFPKLILGGGILISGLLFLIMFSLANVKKSTYLNKVITDNATAALFILDPHDYCTFMNPAAEKLTGYTLEEIRHSTLHNIIHHSHPDGSPYAADDGPIIQTLSGVGRIQDQERIFFHKNGKQIHVSISAQPIYERSKTAGYLLEVRDVSQEKEAEVALKNKNRNLQTLNNIGKNLSAELELKKLLQVVTDSCTELTGAGFGAFFYNSTNEEEEAFMLYTISGVDPKAFSHFPMPRNTHVFSPTFHGEGIIRSADITQDPRYGKNHPYYGMPEGHLPVKSYLAVPVISRSGGVIGGLFFGHPKPGVFTEQAEEIVKGIAAQAAIAIDNSRLFEALQTKNKELIRINNDLDNFVYTASHDLKAPVLNIEGLVYTLTRTLEEGNPKQISKIIDMMKISVLKFKETIQALTEVSKTNKNLDGEIEAIDLQELLNDVKLSINDIIQETGACIKAELECPEIRFSKANLKSILLNLITNAIKYRSPVRTPTIRICCRRESGKIHMSVSDNGLGIPNNYLPKLFMMFTRYHAHVEGTGVGLYLVKRIVENHEGSITVQSEVDKGTTFTIILPEFIEDRVG